MRIYPFGILCFPQTIGHLFRQQKDESVATTTSGQGLQSNISCTS